MPQETVGEKLKRYRKQRNLLQEELGKKIGVSRQLIGFWENGTREIDKVYVKNLCETLNVDEGLLFGEVAVQNQTVASDLGLCNDSIDFLRSLASWQHEYPFPLTTTIDGWANEAEEITSTSPNFFGDFNGSCTVESVYPDEVLSAVNALLSTVEGRSVLAMIYKYISIDFFSGQTDEIVFTDTHSKRKTEIPLYALQYSLGNIIVSLLTDLRKGVQEDGKRP